MKKLLFLLLLTPLFSLAQLDKVVDDKIAASNSLTDKKISDIFIGADTIRIFKRTGSGNYNWDTLSCPVNSMRGYQYVINGFSKTTVANGRIDIWIKNVDGVYSVTNGVASNLFMGTGYSLKGVKVGNLIIVQMVHNNTVLDWTLTKTKL